MLYYAAPALLLYLPMYGLWIIVVTRCTLSLRRRNYREAIPDYVALGAMVVLCSAFVAYQQSLSYAMEEIDEELEGADADWAFWLGTFFGFFGGRWVGRSLLRPRQGRPGELGRWQFGMSSLAWFMVAVAIVGAVSAMLGDLLAALLLTSLAATYVWIGYRAIRSLADLVVE